MTTSGWANSDERDGTSLDTNGMANFQRVRGIKGSTSSARLWSSSFIRPNVTRSIFLSACGMNDTSQSWHMLSCLTYLSSWSLGFSECLTRYLFSSALIMSIWPRMAVSKCCCSSQHTVISCRMGRMRTS